MVEEEAKPTETPETPAEAPKEEAPAVEGEEVVTEAEKPAEPVATEEPVVTEEPADTPAETKALADMKSIVEKLEKDNAKLKTDLKALEEKAVFKSPTPEVAQVKVEEKSRSMLSLIQ